MSVDLEFEGSTFGLLILSIKPLSMETLTAEPLIEKNEILKTIYSRRAVRSYKDKPVPKELIEQLLDAGRMAPSAINKQPWNSCKKFSSTDKVGRSKSFVGSSNTRKLGLRNKMDNR